MKVYKTGTRVKMVIGSIDGMVIGVCIRSASIEYHIRYILNGDIEDIWVNEYEVEPIRSNSTAGFNRSEGTIQEPTTTLLIE